MPPYTARLPALRFGDEPVGPVTHEEGHADEIHADDDPDVGEDGQQQAAGLRLEEGGGEHRTGDEQHERAERTHGEEFLHIDEHRHIAADGDHDEGAAHVEELAHVHVRKGEDAPDHINGQQDDAPVEGAGEGFEEGLGFLGVFERPDVGKNQRQRHDDARALQRDAAGGSLVVEVVVEIGKHASAREKRAHRWRRPPGSANAMFRVED
jgi:hypothetical protein